MGHADQYEPEPVSDRRSDGGPAVTATAVSPEPGLWAPRLRAMTVGSVALISLVAFEALAVGTAMPTVARSLDGLALYGIAFGGSFAASVIGMVVSGIWCDARGPRAPLWHGVGWFVVGLVVAGTAPLMGFLVVGRVVQGFGSGLLSVALYVIVARAYPEDLHRRIFAAFAAAWVVPSLVGPVLAGLIVEHLGWRWVFLAVPALAVPAVLLIHPGLRSFGATVASRVPAGAVARIAWACGAGVSAALLHIGGQQRGVTAVVLVVIALAGLLVCAPRLLPAGFLRAARGLPTVIGLRVWPRRPSSAPRWSSRFCSPGSEGSRRRLPGWSSQWGRWRGRWAPGCRGVSRCRPPGRACPGRG